MKKTVITVVLAMMIGMGLFTTEASAQMAPGGGWGQGNDPQQQGWYCPYCGRWEGPRWGMGRGMMGPGMMQRGWGMGPQYGPQYGPGYQGPQYQQPAQLLDENRAKEILQNYIQSTRNPNIKLGVVEDKGSAFEAEIVTMKEEALVDRIAVDKSTGWLRSVY